MNEVEKALKAAGLETQRLDRANIRTGPIWDCKIGIKAGTSVVLPAGSDFPMRVAVEKAFKEITGLDADFCFSGWGGELTKIQAEVVEDR